MEELLWVGGFVVIWLLLQLVILPKLGIDTCNARGVQHRVPAQEKKSGG